MLLLSESKPFMFLLEGKKIYDILLKPLNIQKIIDNVTRTILSCYTRRQNGLGHLVQTVRKEFVLILCLILSIYFISLWKIVFPENH